MYAPLIAIASKQKMDGKRTHTPVFTPVVLTTFGEFGPGAVWVREWIATRYKRDLAAAPPRPDGAQVSTLMAAFRSDFNMMLAIATHGSRPRCPTWSASLLTFSSLAAQPSRSRREPVASSCRGSQNDNG